MVSTFSDAVPQPTKKIGLRMDGRTTSLPENDFPTTKNTEIPYHCAIFRCQSSAAAVTLGAFKQKKWRESRGGL